MYPAPLSDFFNNFFFTQAKSLSFDPLDTMWRNFIKNIDLLTNYDTFVINDWKFFAKKKIFSYKHMSMIFISHFFIHSLL